MPAGSRIPGLPQPSVRLGIRGEQQPKIGNSFSGAHLSLAQARWGTVVCDSAATLGEVREVAKRTFHRFANVQAHRAGVSAIPADRSAGNAPQTTLQSS